eukprot:349138_1
MNDNSNTLSVKVSAKQIPTDQIHTVYGYMRRHTALFIPQSIIDLLLFFYAKPLVIRTFYMAPLPQIKYIFYCPISETWDSLCKKILLQYDRSNYEIINLKHRGEYRNVNYSWKIISAKDCGHFFECMYGIDQKDLFEVKAPFTVQEMNIRRSWVKGDEVEIFSNTWQDWYIGEIVDIINDEEGEWLNVVWARANGQAMSRQIQRFESDIRLCQDVYQ